MRKLWIAVFSALVGCSVNADKKVSLENFEFKTGDDTELFFKNVRQSYYDLEENKAANFNLFRFKDRIQSDTLPILYLAIVINFLQDEAYLFLEPNDSLATQDPLVIKWQDPENKTNGFHELGSPNREGMLRFADKLYQGIKANHQFSLPNDLPILATKTEREAFRITMADYYRLTRLE